MDKNIILMKQPEENTNYLVKFKSGKQEVRMARFNGFGKDKGWGGTDWAGDTGLSTDSWMHNKLSWWIKIEKVKKQIDTMVMNGGL